MSLSSYHAIQQISPDKGWKISADDISRMDKHLAQFTDGKNLIITPRYNGNYISIRYCGLEVLQINKKKKIYITLEENSKGRIRRSRKVSDSLLPLTPILKKVRIALEDGRMHLMPRDERTIPGFSMEHWLENLILADTEGGRRARKHLGINPELNNVVSQVPVIKDPKSGGKKKRADHIDLFGLKDGGKAVIIELKIDDDYKKAQKELTEYTDWYLSKGKGFDLVIGKPNAMEYKGYMPKSNKNDVEAIAVIMSEEKDKIRLDNGIVARVISLPEIWYNTPDGNPFYSCNS